MEITRSNTAPCGCRGFTLIELMVVISIIVVLLALVAPSLNIGKSTGRKGAISNLTTIIEQARALALSDSRNVYLAFACTLPTNASASLVADYSFRAYAVFEDDATASQKLQVTKWQKLPTGISFRAQAEASAANANSGLGTCITATSNNDTADFAFSPLGPAAAITCPYLAFDSTGSIITPSTAAPMRLVVFDGFVKNGTELPTAREPDNQPLRDEIQIGRYNGRARVVVR